MSLQSSRNEYLFSNLTQSMLDVQPHQQLQTWIDQAKQQNSADYNACSVATATADGIPSVRTVLLKGLSHQGLIFYTNRDSEKGKQLQDNPQAEILFFWSPFNRQVRARGKIIELPREQVESYFQSRPLGSQQASAVSMQSQPIESRDILEQRLTELEAQHPTHIPTPSNWTGFQLLPERWEFWQGREKRFHDCFCYQKDTTADSGWKIVRLQP